MNVVDVTPAVLDLILYAGDGTSLEVDFVDESNVSIDVSALTWKAQIRKTRTSGVAYEIDIDISNAADGKLLIHISAAITRELTKNSQWDLQSVSGSEDPLTVLQGAVTCNPDVTREVGDP